MARDNFEVEWQDVIVLFNSLIYSIQDLRGKIDSDDLDDDELYEVEEELNDYVTVLARLRDKYFELSDKGELPASLKSKLRTIC